MLKKFSLVLALILVSIFISAEKVSAVTFNPDFIISNEEMTDVESMSFSDIELFLRSKGGYISRNYFTNRDGELKSAAQIIYEAANNYDCEGIELSDHPTRKEREEKCVFAPINPKLLLVLLQKEQSLIEELSPTQKQLDWATGYGVCDDCSMSDPAIQRWRGFGKQINSASLQFSDYLNSPHHYSYKAGNTYIISNTGRAPSTVTIQNNATAGLYNYTPHVYNGNFNFFKLWTRYFTRSYPNNSLLQIKGESGVWLINDGKKRPFLSRGALTTRYDLDKVIQVNKSDLDKYPTGAPIKFAQYSILRSPKGTIFLLVDDTRRGFTSQEAFRKIGFNPEEVINASWNDIDAYKEGAPITEDSEYPTGALLQDKSTGGIYYVSEGTKAPLLDRILLDTIFRRKSIFPVEPKKLASYETVGPAIFPDGEILTANNSPAVYIIDNKKKRAVISANAFLDLGYKWENVISVPSRIIDLYEDGEPLGKAYEESNIEIIDPMADTIIDPLSADETQDNDIDDELDEEINDILNP